jgi:preprotein translocase subunit SecG
MLFGLLISFYVVLCIFLILIILIQKGKSSMGLGGLGGGAQMLFGGSGGQDMFQKMTWILTAIFLFGSLVLSLMKTSQHSSFRYIKQQTAPAAPKPLPTIPEPVTNNTRQVTIPTEQTSPSN